MNSIQVQPRRRRQNIQASTDLQIHPKKLSFNQFQLSKTHINKFTIRNRSQRRQPLKILSGQGGHAPFLISYDEKKLIQSHEQLDVYVYFKPQQNRFYSQNIEVMLGNTYNKVQLTAFSMPANKRFSKTIPRQRLDEMMNTQSSEQLSFCEDQQLNFQRRCAQLKNYRVDKQINYQKSIGNNTPSQIQTQSIISQRNQQQTKKIKQIQNQIKTRFSLEHSKQCPVHDRGSNKIVKWQESKNNSSMMVRYCLRKFQKSITKMIKDERFDNIRRILSYYMQLECQKQQIFQKMEKDTQLTLKDQYKWKRGQKNQTKQILQFSKFSVSTKVMWSQHDNLNSTRMFHFDVDPRVSFDDWIPIQQMLENGHQVMKYKYISQPPIISHHPVIQSNYRNGAEQQYPYIQNKFLQLTYPEFQQIQLISYHAFKDPQFFYKIQSYQLSEFQQILQDQQQQNNFTSSQMFNGLNFQSFHYIKLDVETKYDVGFYSDIQKNCDYLIGQIDIEDKIQEANRNDEKKMKRISQIYDKKLKIKIDDIFAQRHSQNQFINNVQSAIGEIKKEKIFMFNTLVKSCNFVTKFKKNRIIF